MIGFRSGWVKDGLFEGSFIGHRPQARRLRRPAARLWGLTLAADGEDGMGAFDVRPCVSPD